MNLTADGHWAAVSRASQIEAKYRAELRRSRREARRGRLRSRIALLLVRAGLHLAGPLTDPCSQSMALRVRLGRND